MADIKSKTTRIHRCIVDTTNRMVILVCDPVKEVNDKGAFRFSNQQFANMAFQLGLTPQRLIRNIRGAKLTFNTEFIKAGTILVNEKTGEQFIAGEKNGGKDYWRNTSYDIQLSETALDRIDRNDAFAANEADNESSFDNSPREMPEPQQQVAEPEAPAVNDAGKEENNKGKQQNPVKTPQSV